jgi:hypothetical protein
MEPSMPRHASLLKATPRAIALPLAALIALAAPAAADRESASDIAFNKACALPEGGKLTLGWGTYPNQDYRKTPVWTLKLPRKVHALHRVSVLRQQGKVRLAKLTTISPSGDWSHVTRYCFRADGTLAFSESTLRTAYGNVKVYEVVAYGRTGKVLKRTRKLYDLKTDKPLAKGARGFQDRKPVMFKTAEAFRRHVSPVLN